MKWILGDTSVRKVEKDKKSILSVYIADKEYSTRKKTCYKGGIFVITKNSLKYDTGRIKKAKYIVSFSSFTK